MVSQPTSIKGSESRRKITEQESAANGNGTFSFNNQTVHPYEAQHPNQLVSKGALAVDKVFSLYKPRRSSNEPSRGRTSHGYESPPSTAFRHDAPTVNENQQQTRNQTDQQRGARRSIEHNGNAEKTGEQNRTPSKYQPLNDLNEMRSMRDQARRFKNNS